MLFIYHLLKKKKKSGEKTKLNFEEKCSRKRNQFGNTCA